MAVFVARNLGGGDSRLRSVGLVGRFLGTAGRRRDLAMPMRLVHLADTIGACHHTTGVAGALDVARQRRGTQFDPVPVDPFIARPAEVLADLDRIQGLGRVDRARSPARRRPRLRSRVAPGPAPWSR